ncbi:MAG: hypothetical protein A2000_06320 [Ignavibacteria bacterium GWB2_36_8]|nr:MAG: hypothetical protein A2000_06320 [Ignavibacteria bacterium GWB2_36_8]OGU52916.1 MAG: hypothetical protein A2080_10390 [Ignavibacteria bacterium GWC2_36_12]
MDITIFDYEVTLDEITHLFVNYYDKQEYMQNTTYRRRLQDLYVLFKMREDRVRAGDVLNELNEKKELNIAS